MRLKTVIIVTMLATLFGAPPRAAGYRPFESTDAAVAGPCVLDAEIGYLLLPSTARDERDLGFAGFAIVSATTSPLLLHVNGGAGVGRDDHAAFPIWGVIAELPLTDRWRVAGEINGENVESDDADASALVGAIWDVPGQPLALDGGVRVGLTGAADDWALTIGFTYGISLLGSAATGRLE